MFHVKTLQDGQEAFVQHGCCKVNYSNLFGDIFWGYDHAYFVCHFNVWFYHGASIPYHTPLRRKYWWFVERTVVCLAHTSDMLSHVKNYEVVRPRRLPARWKRSPQLGQVRGPLPPLSLWQQVALMWRTNDGSVCGIRIGTLYSPSSWGIANVRALLSSGTQWANSPSHRITTFKFYVKVIILVQWITAHTSSSSNSFISKLFDNIPKTGRTLSFFIHWLLLRLLSQ